MKDETQMLFIEKCKIIDEVITLQEASVILGCSDSTLRKKVLSGKFKEGEYRKAKGTILFYKGVVQELKKKSMC